MTVQVDYEADKVTLVYQDMMWVLSANAALRLADAIVDVVEEGDSGEDEEYEDD